jgi:phage repressor protein C with HTH and peptisase S24 domain
MDDLESDTAFVRDLCQWAKEAPSKVASQAGVAATTILRPYNGTATTRIGLATRDKLRAKYPDYPGWRRETSDHIGQMGDRLPPDEPVDELVYVRAVDISLAMGDGIVGEDYPATELIPFNLGFLRTISRAPIDKLRIMTGQGESMEPTLLRSDLLMIDTSMRAPMVSDQIWAFNYAGGGMLKRLRRVRDDNRDRFLIISNNPAVPAQLADIEDVFVIGKLVWIGRQM